MSSINHAISLDKEPTGANSSATSYHEFLKTCFESELLKVAPEQTATIKNASGDKLTIRHWPVMGAGYLVSIITRHEQGGLQVAQVKFDSQCRVIERSLMRGRDMNNLCGAIGYVDFDAMLAQFQPFGH